MNLSPQTGDWELLINDEEAVRRCQDGDREAFHHLVDRYKDLLYGTACLMTGDTSMAEEHVQEALISAWRGMGTFRTGRPVKPWMVRILVNTVMGQHRRRLVQTVPLETSAELAEHEGPAELAEQGESSQRVHLAISALSEEHRHVIMLRYFADLSVPEIGRVMGCRQGTVKSRLFRAIRRLRFELEEPPQRRGEENDQ